MHILPVRFLVIFTFTVCLMTLGSACTKLAPEEPLRVKAPKRMQADTSVITLPITYPQAELSKKINALLPEELLKDKKVSAGLGTEVLLNIRRNGLISLEMKGRQAYIQLPLRIRSMVSKKGLPALPSEFAATLFLRTSVDLNSSWQLLTRLDLEKVTWQQEPTIQLSIFKIKLTGPVEKAIEKYLPEVLVKIDEKIKEEVSLVVPMTNVWASLQKPVLLNQEYTPVWMSIEPFRISISPITGRSDGMLTTQAEIHTLFRIWVAKQPDSQPIALPSLHRHVLRENQFRIHLLAAAPFPELNRRAQDFLSQQTFDIQGHKIRIKEAEVFGSYPFVTVRLAVRGAAKGQLFLQGIPAYSTSEQRLYMDSLDYSLDTEELLLRSAEWLLHGQLQEELKQKLQLPIQTYTRQIPELIDKALQKSSLNSRIVS